MTDFTSATRKRVVEKIDICHLKPGDKLFPIFAFAKDEKQCEVWEVYTTIRNGLMPSYVVFERFFSDKELNEYLEEYSIGIELSDIKNPEVLHRFVRKVIDRNGSFSANAGDFESTLAFQVLADSGILDDDFESLNEKVTNFLDDDRILLLKRNFKEVWKIVAIFEYCFVNFPHSSAVFLAASYKYHFHVTGDKFSAGYYWRDLEIMVHRVEETAAKTIATRQKAGQSGSRQSAQAKAKRRAALFEKISLLIERNPDIAKFGDEAVAKLAVEDCKNENPSLWKQGRGQVSDYLGEIRRGDGGPDMQKRYQAIFGSKPPKRFKG